MFCGWMLITWAIVQGSPRKWAASIGLYLLTLVAIEALIGYYGTKAAESKRGPR